MAGDRGPVEPQLAGREIPTRDLGVWRIPVARLRATGIPYLSGAVIARAATASAGEAERLSELRRHRAGIGSDVVAVETDNGVGESSDGTSV